MNSTHNTNHLVWLLYNLMSSNKQEEDWVPEAHILTACGVSDIVAAELHQISDFPFYYYY